ncbi:hypothetical protein EPN28_01265 [Patescibacteria group bacterium]|nr:MAG: hypothetical protein EPN28_01265 [Patescibacteria group bacterium]
MCRLIGELDGELFAVELNKLGAVPPSPNQPPAAPPRPGGGAQPPVGAGAPPAGACRATPCRFSSWLIIAAVGLAAVAIIITMIALRDGKSAQVAPAVAPTKSVPATPAAAAATPAKPALPPNQIGALPVYGGGVHLPSITLEVARPPVAPAPVLPPLAPPPAPSAAFPSCDQDAECLALVAAHGAGARPRCPQFFNCR